jgi:hypothetical protein
MSLFFLFMGGIPQMAFAADNGLARSKNAGNSRKNEGSSLRPGGSSVLGNICSFQVSLKISLVRMVVSVAFFILNLHL